MRGDCILDDLKQTDRVRVNTFKMAKLQHAVTSWHHIKKIAYSKSLKYFDFIAIHTVYWHIKRNWASLPDFSIRSFMMYTD